MSKNERFFDLAFEKTPDGTVRLTQEDYGESSVIEAHPEQLRFIARRLCGLDEVTAMTVEDLERKISVLADEIEFIVMDKGFRRDIIDGGNGSEFELLAKLDGLWSLAMEFDGGRLLPRFAQSPQEATKGGKESRPKETPVSPPERAAKAVCEENTVFVDQQMPLLGS